MKETIPDDVTLQRLALRVANHLLETNRKLATAESCTGGWIAKVLTDIAGSSHWFDYGLVSYSNAAKQELVGVATETLVHHGAVSEETTREMAEGAIRDGGADVSVSVSGIAGPSGGTPDKPVGTVWFAWAQMTAGGLRSRTEMRRFPGGRDAVRRQSVAVALEGLLAS